MMNELEILKSQVLLLTQGLNSKEICDENRVKARKKLTNKSSSFIATRVRVKAMKTFNIFQKLKGKRCKLKIKL